MNIPLTKGEICTSANLIKVFSSDTQVFFFYVFSDCTKFSTFFYLKIILMCCTTV